MRDSNSAHRLVQLLVLSTISSIALACSGAAPSVSAPSSVSKAAATPSAPSASILSPVPSKPAAATTQEPSQAGSEPPDTGGGTTSGDVPDNAVFLTFKGGSPTFSIQYVEGWQVRKQPDGVVIRDKDSSETVAIVATQADVAGYVASTDLPALQAQSGFKLVKQNTVKVGAERYDHLVYHLLSPADPVTGKQVPSTVDRYYVPGPDGLALVSLSTPDGVDNVDAFRKMIESFKWS